MNGGRNAVSLALGAASVLTLCGAADAPRCPNILSISVTPSVLRSGIEVTATVRTSDDATAVVAQVHRRTIPVPQLSTGVFSGTAVVPRIPRFIRLHVPVTFTASNANGAAASRTISVQIN